MQARILIQPVYRSAEVGRPIHLGEGPVEIEADGTSALAVGKATLRLHPSPDLVIEARISESTKMNLWSARGSVSMRYGGSKKAQALITSISFRSEEESLDVDVELKPNPQRLIFADGKQSRLASMIFHIVNFPSFLSSGDGSTDIRYKDENAESTKFMRLGCSILEDTVWKIEIQELPETSKFSERMKHDGGGAITHVGKIIRKDGRLFSVSSATKALGKLYLFLSFVRGGWTSPLLCIGLNRSAEKIYEDWSQRLSTPSEVRTSWFDVHHGEWMARLYPGFVALLEDAAMGKAVSSALYWYLRSNSGGSGFGVDSGIILSQAALERLSSAYIGSHKVVVSKNASAAQRLREVLHLLKIPRAIPSETPHIRAGRRKHGWSDGPEALTKVRNELIHPGRLKVGKAVPDIWRLAQWYIELIVLRLAGYDGNYSNRLKARWVGEFEPVPWLRRRRRQT